MPWNFYMTLISRLVKRVLMKQKPGNASQMQQNAQRYRGIRLCCDITDVNNTENSSQERWQHDLRLTWSYPS